MSNVYDMNTREPLPVALRPDETPIAYFNRIVQVVECHVAAGRLMRGKTPEHGASPAVLFAEYFSVADRVWGCTSLTPLTELLNEGDLPLPLPVAVAGVAALGWASEGFSLGGCAGVALRLGYELDLPQRDGDSPAPTYTFDQLVKVLDILAPQVGGLHRAAILRLLVRLALHRSAYSGTMLAPGRIGV